VKSLLFDIESDRALKEEGYVILPLLNSGEVETLKSFYYDHHPEKIERMYASAHSDDIAYRLKMSENITRMVRPHITQSGDRLKTLGASFIIKGNNPGGTLPPHQDWNLVDETSSRSFNLWIPLVDTSEENGGIQIIPRSHLFSPTYRGPNISSSYEKVTSQLWEKMITLNIPAGHGLLYDHRLLHASGVNRTGEPRLVAVMGIIEEGTPMYIYYRNGEFIEEYRCDEQFFLTQNPQKGPQQLQLNRSFQWHFPSFGTTEINSFAQKYQLDISIPEEPGNRDSSGNPSFFIRIRSLIFRRKRADN